MRLPVVFRYIGMIILLNAVFMALSAAVSLFNNYDTSFYPLLLSAVLTAALGGFPLIFVAKDTQLSLKEGYVVVVGAWLLACIVGTFPYLLWGGEFDVWTAWFESVSGFTTTGSTALEDIEVLPRGLLFWRSSTHWLGGLGVVMFVLIIMPTVGKTKMTLTNVELSTLAKENYKYKSQKIIKILLVLYLGLTLFQTLALKIAGMNLFDAVNHSFSTIATGGFSTRDASIASFNSVLIENIIMFFMALAGIHFGLIFATVTGKSNNLFKSEVVRFYLATILITGFFIGLNLWMNGIYSGVFQSLRYAYFQVVSVITTTGFATSDTAVWTPFCIIILTYLMFQCACAGSTSGGIKSDRILLAYKAMKARLLQQQHPNAIIRVKLNGVIQSESVINSVLLFIVLYVILVLVGTAIVSAAGPDLISSFSMIAASMSNVGPGFGSVGSMGTYSELSPFIKSVCTIFMLLGRLEIFGLLQLFLIKSWR